ncbi:MAG TPA: polysaccharide biosynthesis C-terminal domain-containing protein [Thermoplasmata archaeon]|nr:polysaccharide biosynthesis C-terminal domain-containing protein [Thermoplasmata archaeon]
MTDTKGAPDAGPARRPSVGLSSSVVFLITIAIQAIGYAASYFTSHHIGGMGADGLAILSISGLYLLIASTLSGLGDLRVGSAYVFYVARGRDPRSITSTYLALRLGLVAVASAAAFLLSPLLPFVHGSACGGLSRADEFTIFGLFMLIPLLWSPGVVYGQLWVARGNSIRGQYPLLVQSVVQTVGLITVALVAQTPQVAIWGIVGAYLIGGVASAAYSLPSVASYTVGRPSGAEARRLFIYAWPLMGGLFLQYIASNTLPFFVQGVSEEAVTIFLAANGFRILLMGLPNAVSVPLFPHLTNLHVQREYEVLRRRTWLALRYTAMLIIPAAIAFVAYRSNLLDLLFGHNYVSPPLCPGQSPTGSSAPLGSSGSVALALLAVSAIPAALTGIILTALNSVGRQRLELYLQALTVVILLGVSFLVLPPYSVLGNWGLSGAGWAVLISSVGGFLLNVYFLERILAVRIQPRPILAIVASAAASFLVISRLNTVINPTHWYTLGFALVLGFTSYFVVLALSGELSKTDVRQIGSFLGLPASVGDLFARACWREETRDHGELLVGERGEESDATLDSTRIDPNAPDKPQRPRGLG